jgi:hypothetical protein
VKHKNVIIAIVVTWLLISFVPQLSLMSLLGKGKGKGKKG